MSRIVQPCTSLEEAEELFLELKTKSENRGQWLPVTKVKKFLALNAEPELAHDVVVHSWDSGYYEKYFLTVTVTTLGLSVSARRWYIPHQRTWVPGMLHQVEWRRGPGIEFHVNQLDDLEVGIHRLLERHRTATEHEVARLDINEAIPLHVIPGGQLWGGQWTRPTHFYIRELKTSDDYLFYIHRRQLNKAYDPAIPFTEHNRQFKNSKMMLAVLGEDLEERAQQIFDTTARCRQLDEQYRLLFAHSLRFESDLAPLLNKDRDATINHLKSLNENLEGN